MKTLTRKEERQAERRAEVEHEKRQRELAQKQARQCPSCGREMGCNCHPDRDPEDELSFTSVRWALRWLAIVAPIPELEGESWANAQFTCARTDLYVMGIHPDDIEDALDVYTFGPSGMSHDDGVMRAFEFLAEEGY